MVSDINYTPNTSTVTIPEPNADESTWVSTANKVLALLDGNLSVAFNTDDFVDTKKSTGIEETAMMFMNGRQKKAYLEWKDGDLKLREWSWDQTKDVTNPKDWGAKISALKRIYDVKELSAEQTKAWVLANWDLHALWGAVIHVVKAERAACGGHEDKDPLAFVEAVACRKLLKRLAMHTYKKEYAEGHAFIQVKAGLEERLKIFRDEA